MDSETAQFLEINGLIQYIDIFKQNKIGIGELIEITAEDLRDLIAPVGDRQKFRKALKSILSNVEKTDDANINTFNFDALCDPQEPPRKKINFKTEIPLMTNLFSDDWSGEKLLSEEKKTGSSDELSIPSLTFQVLSTSETPQFDLSTICSTSGSTAESSTSALVNCSSVLAAKSSATSKSADQTSKKTIIKTKEDFKIFLNTCEDGKTVLSIFENEGKLNRQARNKLTSAIYCKLQSDYGAGVNNSHFEKLANLIPELFPQESSEIYYVAPYTEGKLQKISKGKLPSKQRNMRTAAKKNGSIARNNDQRPPSQRKVIDNLLPEAEFVESKTWLSHYSEPWTKVLSLWKQTAPNRHQQLQHGQEIDIAGILKEWPLYRAPLGYTLIAIDFKALYPNKELAFLNNWSARREKLVAVLQKRLTANDRKLLSIIKTDSSGDATVLRLLPAILPPTIIREGKQSFKPTILESQDQFLIHAKTSADANIMLQQRKKKYEKLYRSLQPLVIVVGENLTEIKSSYVYVEDTMYRLDNPLSAIDICFKIFHVLNLKYPVEAQNVWIFLQRFYYNIEDINEQCKVPFVRAETLFWHLQVCHFDENRYICGQDECGREFQNFYSFKRHIKNKHPPTQVEHQDELMYVDHPATAIEPVNLGERIIAEENVLPDIELPDDNFVEKTFKKLEHSHISYLHKKQTLPRSGIQDIINNDANLLSSIGTLLETVVIPTDESRENFQNILKFLNNPFAEQATEYKRMQLLKKAGVYIEPEKIFLGQRIDEKIVEGEIVHVPVEITASFVPLRQLFTVLFSKTDIFQMADTYLHKKIGGNVIEDIAHSNYWITKKQQFGNKFVIPLYLYYDEFECNNPLGTHTGVHKLGAVYISIRCFPLKFHSRLQNIFLALLAHYPDIAEYGNRVFQILVDELIFLETEGISIKLENGEKHQVYFALVMILGDNAGLNSILGFSSCSSNYFCRMCRGHKKEILKNIEEVDDILRTRENYENDVRTNDYTLTGIKESCVFNTIPSFHVVENYAVDVMHDMLEGVGNFDMTLIIDYYVTSGMISLETVNTRVQSFDYGYVERGNKPPYITHLILTKKKLNFKAIEMMCFIRNFGLMIGDLIPEEDSVWNLYTTLCQIMDLVLSPYYHIGTHNLLKSLIEEHHILYIDTCKKVPRYESLKHDLKPKLHYMKHYPRILRVMGPLRNFWCMRFEAKHAVGKTIAAMTGSRINICQTIALTEQLRLAYNIHDDSMFKDELEQGPRDIAGDYYAFGKSYATYKWAKYNGRIYKAGETVLYVDVEDYFPLFGLISQIFIHDSTLYFTFKELRVNGFDEHVHSYVINESYLECPHVRHMSVLDLQDKTPMHLRNMYNNYFVTVPYSL